MLPKVDARPKLFFVSFFLFGFFSALWDFFSKIFGLYQRVPPCIFWSFRFVKTFNEPEWLLFEFFGIVRLEKKTRRDRLKSAPYLRLKNIQGTTIGNICKKLFFFKKIIFVYQSTCFEKNFQKLFFWKKNYFFANVSNSCSLNIFEP